MTLIGLRDEFPAYTSPVMVVGCVNEEHEDISQNCFIEENCIEVHDEMEEKSVDTENQDVIHRHINVNEKETSLHTLEEVNINSHMTHPQL